jgi:NADPH:quinone reductase-like Zn-dependent oxidoreductase
MRVVQATRFGGPEVLVPSEAPDPLAGPGQVVVDVSAVSVLFVETQIRRGHLGADAVVDYAEPDWPEQVREATGGHGADMVSTASAGRSAEPRSRPPRPAAGSPRTAHPAAASPSSTRERRSAAE